MIEPELITLISNVGFPIAAFLLMWFYINRTMKENTAALIELKLAIQNLYEFERSNR